MFSELSITLFECPNIVARYIREPYPTVMKNIIEQIGYNYNIEIIEFEIPVDHIHMIVRSESKIFPCCSSFKEGRNDHIFIFVIKYIIYN